jgi:hypothetical protein
MPAVRPSFHLTPCSKFRSHLSSKGGLRVIAWHEWPVGDRCCDNGIELGPEDGAGEPAIGHVMQVYMDKNGLVSR